MVRGSDFEEEASYFSDDPIDLNLKKRNSLSARINQSLMVFVLLITSTIFLGSTLAANISLSGGRVEFGQGSAGLKACSATNQVGIKTRAEYTLSGHKLKSVELSNIPTSCYGYNIIVSILQPGADGSNTLATLFSTVKRLVILDRSGTFYTSQADSSYVTLTSTNNAITNTDTVLISFNTPEVLTTDIGSIGIESSENTITGLPCGAGGDCALGATGPGGGTVVVYFDETFEAPGSECGLACRGIEIDKTQINLSAEWTRNSANQLRNGQTNGTRTGLGGGFYNTKLAFESANGSNNSNQRYGAVASCWNKSTSSATDRWYLPNVMEYAYIFKQIKESAALRTAVSGWPAVTNYYSSEEVTSSYSASGYVTIFNNGGPPSGVTVTAQVVGTPGPTQALAVAPARQLTPSFLYVTNTSFNDYMGMHIFNHEKNNGYAYFCLHAFK
jgi:hypothetical protein